MNRWKLFRNHRDRMIALLSKRGGLEYPTHEMFIQATIYAKSRIEGVAA